ncbi:CRIB domain-containing protein RIC7-like [Tripterygium wilfordii]|uniref:CRIB domain-containing protein RIC7-like n=1 Tax=Tripterygium wilfordii TaxID=458696 RepID=UPI0018F84D01|nr:CRIB domain-containing protein RIC7-like [Tripterygium wilfordii]
MGTKVKGLLKGLRYISQMFDEKEPEMQIGLPTDVKHVAHIGWDGPSANTPSWMNGFKSAPEFSASEPLNLIGEAKSPFTNKLSLEDVHQIDQNGNERPKHRSRRSTNSTTGSALNSPTRRSSDAPRPSRRNHNSNFDSPSRDSSGSSRISRRQQTTSSLGLESPSHEQPAIPKQSRRKKSKGGSGGSSRSSRSKGQNPVETSDPGSVTESVEGLKSKEDLLSSVLETYEEEK